MINIQILYENKL